MTIGSGRVPYADAHASHGAAQQHQRVVANAGRRIPRMFPGGMLTIEDGPVRDVAKRAFDAMLHVAKIETVRGEAAT